MAAKTRRRSRQAAPQAGGQGNADTHMHDGVGNAALHDMLLGCGSVSSAMDTATSERTASLPYRSEMESIFGVNLGGVQASVGGASATAGLLALDAHAATDGQRFAFMDANPSKEEVAEEVAHYAQGQLAAGSAAPSRVSSPTGGAEREAASAAKMAAAGRPVSIAEKAAPGTIHRSWLGAGIGGVLGGVALGPLGAVGGLLAGDYVTSDRRDLTDDEKDYSRETYGDSVDYDEVEIVRNSIFSTGSSRTVGNSMYMEDNHFKDEDGLELKDDPTEYEGRNTALAHEMGHVRQYQKEGYGYIPQALYDQAEARWNTGSRSNAYDWKEAEKAGIPFDEWGPEQQAEALQEYDYARMNDDGDKMNELQSYVDEVKGGNTQSCQPDPETVTCGG
jgi:hypothetical protein